MYIILTGNPVDGLTFFGPFEDGEQAGDWAESELSGSEWWISEVKEVN